MRKIFCFILFCCLAVEGIFAYAEDGSINKYTIDYISYCDTEVASSVVTGYSDVLEEQISKVRPKQEGFEFLGWSYSEQDYVNSPIIQPGETVKISSSVIPSVITITVFSIIVFSVVRFYLWLSSTLRPFVS